MPSLREEQKRLTHDRLLDAAVRVFSQKSFVDATMEEIAAAAGVARVTVYAHFSNKTDLIQALAASVYATMGDVFAGLAALPEWNRASVRAWLENAAKSWREMAPALRVAHVAGPAALPSADLTGSRGRYVAEHERYAQSLLTDADRWRSVPAPEARQRATMAVLSTESFLNAWVAAGLSFPTADPLSLLADSLCHQLGPAVAAGRTETAAGETGTAAGQTGTAAGETAAGETDTAAGQAAAPKEGVQ